MGSVVMPAGELQVVIVVVFGAVTAGMVASVIVDVPAAAMAAALEKVVIPVAQAVVMDPAFPALMTTLLQRTHSHVCIVFCKRHVLTSLCF
jgi:hypothetical protein